MRVVECLDILEHAPVLFRNKVYRYALPTKTTTSADPENDYKNINKQSLITLQNYNRFWLFNTTTFIPYEN